MGYWLCAPCGVMISDEFRLCPFCDAGTMLGRVERLERLILKLAKATQDIGNCSGSDGAYITANLDVKEIIEELELLENQND
jgi:hypothetical protein